MKTISTLFISLSACIILTNCSSDSESIHSKIQFDNENASAINILEPLAEIGAVEIAGLLKMMKKFENGILIYWAEYYYNSNGKLNIVRYSHPNSEATIFSDSYYYDTDGKLVKLDGHDIYTYYWDQDRIVKVHRYNAMWSGNSEIFYEYNDQGNIIQKLEINIDFNYQQKLQYTYFEDGNLKSIEDYGDYNGSGVFKLYTITTFADYIEPRNLFLDLHIIPGQNELYQFPSSMAFKHLTSSGYDFNETYGYKYDTLGRVIEKQYGKNKIVYNYY